jgi:pSer/pThr/pTyr-binding forkhead associated (FHA) protein
MAMVPCPNCGRENAGHFNFCLDCGTELSRKPEPPVMSAPPVAAVVSAPPPPAAPAPVTVPPGVVATLPPSAVLSKTSPAQAAASWGSTQSAAPAQPAAPAMNTCTICKAQVAAHMKFCGECGARMDPSAPMPNASSQAAAVAKQTQFLHAADVVGIMQPKARLIAIDPTGKEGMSFNLKAAETVCGRVNGMILLDDPCVSPTHCTFKFSNGRLSVVDGNSLNGLFVRLRAEVELQTGDVFRMGRQLMRFEAADAIPREPVVRAPEDDTKGWGAPSEPLPWGRLVQLLDDGRVGEVRLLRGAEVKLGREVGEIVYPLDGFVSAQHCVVASRGGKATLRDLGSSNGTYLRVRGERALVQDDFILVGNQMLRVDQR